MNHADSWLVSTRNIRHGKQRKVNEVKKIIEEGRKLRMTKREAVTIN